MDFIEAATVCGTRRPRLLFRELLPNVVGPVIVYGTTSLGGMLVLAAGLSFLGAGGPTAGRRLGHHGVGRTGGAVPSHPGSRSCPVW